MENVINIEIFFTHNTGRGKTIIVTLHQPSSELYEMFDRIYLMAEGRLAFTGTGDEAVAFFKK